MNAVLACPVPQFFMTTQSFMAILAESRKLAQL